MELMVARAWPTPRGGQGRAGPVVRGRAAVARPDGPPPDPEPGAVLVVEWLPAAWVPELKNVVAVVTEVGGLLSRPATLLRERAIPAVLGVDGATRAIGDGDLVEVDPFEGAVRLLAAPAGRR